MARITVEDCLDNVDNRYELVMLATKRVRQLYKGSDPLVSCKNRQIVTSLREIAAGKVLTVAPDLPEAVQEDDELAAFTN